MNGKSAGTASTPQSPAQNQELDRRKPSEMRILKSVGLKVVAIIKEFGALPRFQEMVRCWYEDWRKKREAEIEFERHDTDHARKVQCSSRLANESAGPPHEGWIFKTFRVRRQELALKLGLPRPWHVIGGWFPPELAWDKQPNARFPLPLPFPDESALSLAEMYAALAAVHDATTRGTARVNPWLEAPEDPGKATYGVLLEQVQNTFTLLAGDPGDDQPDHGLLDEEPSDEDLLAIVDLVQRDVESWRRTRKAHRQPELDTEAKSVDSGQGEARLPGEQCAAADASSDADEEKRLSPSRNRALAVYEWAMEQIPGADTLTMNELLAKIEEKLKLMIDSPPPGAGEIEKLEELLEALPSQGETFARYLREAGVKRSNRKGDRVANFNRRSELS